MSLQRATGPIARLPSIEAPRKAISSWLLGPKESFSTVLTGMLSPRWREGYLGGSIPGLGPFAGSGPQRTETSRFSSSQGYISVWMMNSASYKKTFYLHLLLISSNIWQSDKIRHQKFLSNRSITYLLASAPSSQPLAEYCHSVSAAITESRQRAASINHAASAGSC